MGKNKTLIKSLFVSVVVITSIALGGLSAKAEGAKKDITDIKKGIVEVERIYGGNRLETAVQIGKKVITGKVEKVEKVENVVIVNGYDYKNAIVAGPLAKKLNAPMLLVGEDYSEAVNFVKENAKEKVNIYLIGQELVGNEKLVAQLKKVSKCDISPITGKTPQEVFYNINYLLSAKNPEGVVVAKITDFPDALSMSSIASIEGYPIILTATDKLDEYASKTITEMNPKAVFIIGGTGAISKIVESQLKKIMPENSVVERVSGKDRYETSAAIVNRFLPYSDTIIVATGENYPDALVGCTLASKEKAPILLISSDNSNVEVIKNGGYKKVYILGGKGVVSESIEQDIKASEKK